MQQVCSFPDVFQFSWLDIIIEYANLIFLDKFTMFKLTDPAFIDYYRNGKSEKNNCKKTALNFGLLLGAISVVFGFVLYSLDIHYQQDSSTSVIGYAIMIAIILIGIIQFKYSNEGYISLSEALKTGVGTALVSSIIVCFYTFFMIKYLDPEFLDKSIEYQKQNASRKSRNLHRKR